MISTKKIAICALIIAVFTAKNITAPFATVTDAKNAVTTAVAANGPVGGFLAMPQVDPAPINTAITNLKAVQAQFAASTDPKIVAALKDLTDSCITPWTTLLATIPNMNDEKTKFATAQTTLTTAIDALDANTALAVIAKAKTEATTAVASTTQAITAAVNALTAARKALDTITSDPLLTSGGATAPAMPWSVVSGATSAPATPAVSSTTTDAKTTDATAPAATTDATAPTTTVATPATTSTAPNAATTDATASTTATAGTTAAAPTATS